MRPDSGRIILFCVESLFFFERHVEIDRRSLFAERADRQTAVSAVLFDPCGHDAAVILRAVDLKIDVVIAVHLPAAADRAGDRAVLLELDAFRAPDGRRRERPAWLRRKGRARRCTATGPCPRSRGRHGREWSLRQKA